MNDQPEYYTAASLAKAAGVSVSQLYRHIENNAGNIQHAKETVPSLGVVFSARKPRTYLGMRAAKQAGQKLRQLRTAPAVQSAGDG